MQQALLETYSEADYLAEERASATKHEYVAGEVFAMAGASKTHGTLAGNAFFMLRSHLRGKPCGVWIAGMKVRIKADNAFYYPDVVVTCDTADLRADSPEDYLQAPKLVLEVLSDSTESIDRREKRIAYRHLNSLEEYGLIDPKRRWIEVYRRSETGWTQNIFEGDESFRLASVDLEVPLSELYADTGVE